MCRRRLSQVVATDASKLPPVSSVWIKRYDFHATQPDDVMYVASEDGWRMSLERFAGRGIPFVVVQEHVTGDLIKFYGVARGAPKCQTPTGSNGSITETRV